MSPDTKKGTSKSKTILTTGNYAAAEGAIAVGCRFFGGYPITPSSEIAHYMSRRLPQVGGTFVQFEDELASIVAVTGASFAGAKAMTATSGPGLSLMAETVGLGFILEAPMVIVTVMRGGPSTGQPTKASQADVMQTRYLSHGDYETIVLAPGSVQECYDFTIRAFNLAEKYRTPVIVATDGIVGQMMEPVQYHSNFEIINRKPPQVSPDKYQPFEVYDDDLVPGMAIAGSEYNFYVTGLTHDNTGSPDMTPETQVALNKRLCDKVRNARPDINDWDEHYLEDAETVILSYGINSRGTPETVERIRKEGHKIGYVRLKTLWPFPDELMERIGKLGIKKVIVSEMNYGQMIREVERFRHLGIQVSGILEPTTIPFSPNFIYKEVMKEL